MNYHDELRYKNMVRLPENGEMPVIPEDDYEAVYNAICDRQSASDSLLGGLWTWRKILIGYLGRKTGVMLSPEWEEVLEFSNPKI